MSKFNLQLLNVDSRVHSNSSTEVHIFKWKKSFCANILTNVVYDNKHL